MLAMSRKQMPGQPDDVFCYERTPTVIAVRVSHIFWHEVQWGNVPSWISGVLSSISIVLAFYILLRDRRKAEREQVYRLVVVVERKSVRQHNLTHHITLINSSDQPFYNLSSRVCKMDNKEARRKGYAPTPNQWWKYKLYIRRLRWSATKGARTPSQSCRDRSTSTFSGQAMRPLFTSIQRRIRVTIDF